jgi:hypothetical protein
MTVETYAALGVMLVTIIGFVWRVSYMLNRKVSYESFDRFKADVTSNYVHREVFDLTYDQMKSDIAEIKVDIKKLLEKAGGG